MAAQVRRLHETLRQSEQIYMVLVSLVVGLLAGFCAVGFRLLIQALNRLAWQQGPYTLEHLAALPFWWKLVVPAIGGLVVGSIIFYFAREAKGHGVPEVMEAVALSSGRIRPRVVVAKMFASGVCIGTGGSVGREGPIVQIGSALGSAIGQWLKIEPRRLKTLVGCGAAGGIAATFNAPVAGALFAVEIILGDFGVAQFSPIVISSVAATVVSHRFLGDFPAFEVPGYSLVTASELFAYAGLGILAALTALAFIRTLYRVEDLFDRVSVYPPVKAMVGGLMIGAIGIWAPHIFGVGYQAINEIVSGNLIWQLALVLIGLKILAVAITIGSGGSGGVFAPSLFIGAMLGGVVGAVVQAIWPWASAGPGAYALVGMGAVVAAATHAPITAILIIFELTADYAIILPLMISCIIATLLSTRIQSASIYTLKLLRRGVDIRRGRAVNVLDGVPVREIMRDDLVTVSSQDGMLDLLSKFIDHPGSTLFVTNEEDELVGLITADEIRPLMKDPASLEGLVIAEDVKSARRFPAVRPDDPLSEVMKFLGSYRGEIPVEEDGKLVGVIWPEDVIERYNSEIFKRDMAGSVASTVSEGGRLRPVTGSAETAMAEVPVPVGFVGRTIRELAVRQNYGVSILVVKRVSAEGKESVIASPGADHRFEKGDTILVMGPERGLTALDRGILLSGRGV